MTKLARGYDKGADLAFARADDEARKPSRSSEQKGVRCAAKKATSSKSCAARGSACYRIGLPPVTAIVAPEM